MQSDVSVLSKNTSTAIKLKMAQINRQDYEIKEGETILAFVKRHFGKDYIPTLCDAPIRTIRSL